MSFLYSSADMAYGVVSISKLEKAGTEKKRYWRALRLAKNYDRTIATILFVNDIVNAGIDSISTLLGVNLCFLILGEADAVQVSENWGLIASMIVLVLKIIFGEIIAKSVAKMKSYNFAVLYSGWIQATVYLFLPIVYPIGFLGEKLGKLFKKNIPEVEVGEDDLHEMVNDIQEQGVVDSDKADMLHDTIRYTHTEAEEIMTPRVDVFAIDIADPIEEVLQQEEIYKYSRIPVYEDTIDNIIGFIRTKELLFKKINEEEIDLRSMLYEPFRFPQSAEINDILREFKKSKSHFALVIDEYGGLDGIVTMEDVLEDIVGEIWDEKDKVVNPIVDRHDGSFIIDGTVTLEDFCDLFEIDFDKIDTEYVTVAGFMIELLNDRFAKVGDEMDFEGVHIKVLAVDENDTVTRIIAEKRQDKDE